MNLGDFHTQIKENIRRGTSLDGRIPTFVRQAARWLERNNTLQYMKRLATISIDPETTDTPQYVELTGSMIKSIYFFRWVTEGDDGTFLFNYLTYTDPKDQKELSVGMPAFYYPDGVNRLVLSAIPNEVLNGELQVARYSAWPTHPSSAHWLLDNAEDVLEAATMMQVAKYTRDPEMGGIWKGVLDMNISSLYSSDLEFIWQNSDMVMGEG